MALMKTYITDFYGTPVQIANAYYQVATLNGSKSMQQIFVSVFNNAQKDKQIEVLTYSFVPNLESSENFIAQAYNYLKTLPEFANAVDC